MPFQKGNKLWFGRKHTEETKARISKSHIGMVHSKEIIDKISKKLKGRKVWNKGIKYEAISGDKNWNWKGGIKKRSGYIMIRNFEHPFCDKQGYIQEHRLIMEKHLGRYLTKKEVVHHINDIRNDNRIENLKLYENNGKHISETLTGIPKKIKHISP